jgi:predicted nucleic acid-binding protein
MTSGYLLDTSAIWHMFRDPSTFDAWRPARRTRLLRVCEPTRTEFLFSAKNSIHRDEMAQALDDLCDLAPVPKAAWRWVDTVQYKLTQLGQHRAAGAIDLVVCATAAHHGLTLLHRDNDFATVARIVDLVQLDVRDRVSQPRDEGGDPPTDR